MSNGDARVNTNEMNDAYWENILQNFNNTVTITDFQTLQNIANRVYYIPPERCMLEYGMTEGNGSDDRSKMPDSGNHCQNNDDRLHVFKRMVENYKSIWDELDNKERNFVYTCTQGGYVDTLGLFFLNRLQRDNMVESQDKYLDNLLIDLDTLDLTNLPESDFPGQDYSQYQNEDFGLPKAYDGNLNNDQLDEFPMPENTVEKQFEECQRIYKDVQGEIDKNDTRKQAMLDKYYEEIVEKKSANDYEALIQLQQKILDLPYRN